MSLRVGYINVQGLNQDKWPRVKALLNDKFDILFVAETWFSSHDRYSRENCFVASTPNLSREARVLSCRSGRDTDGLYLLATTSARAAIKGKPMVTKYAITIRTVQGRLSAVYFPPSLATNTVSEELLGLSTSCLILGDINTRFPNCKLQTGTPGPRDRITAFADFLGRTSLRHVMPEEPHREPSINPKRRVMYTRRLTVDHCFTNRDARTTTLRLLSNAVLAIHTDHLYTLSIELQADGLDRRPLQCRDSKSTHLPGEPVDAKRYRTRRLRDVAVQEKVRAYVISYEEELRPILRLRDVDEIFDVMVTFCQRLCERELGVQKDIVERETRLRKITTTYAEPLLSVQDQASSIRLYKKASVSDRQNRPIQPTAQARQKGTDALTENYNIFRQMYTMQFGAEEVDCYGFRRRDDCYHDIPEHYKTAAIIEEISKQNLDKSCGRDGIHIRLFRVLLDTPFLDYLSHLYYLCAVVGRTPRIWNESDIHLIVKDKDGPVEAGNLRPITLINVFRKLFERLLLREFNPSTGGWAKLHRNQAGFRHGYSTSTNAAVVHHLLSTKACDRAVFLDLRAAFDRVDHRKLYDILHSRACSPRVLSLLSSLMFEDVRSRIIVNGRASAYFPRTRGVLQGSPLSPYLFNIFIDGLLDELNQNCGTIPRCLFFADDGVILGRPGENLQPILDGVSDWLVGMNLELNVGKCNYISQLDRPEALYLNRTQQVPQRENVKYLGFPVTASGIDFERLISQNLLAAKGRTNFIATFSDAWGVYHRLQVFKIFIAPMIEYGAPLVYAWMKESSKNEKRFDEIVKANYPSTIGWVSNATGDNANFRAELNIYGILPLRERFAQLRTMYQVVLDRAPDGNPLKTLRKRQGELKGTRGGDSFIANLIEDDGWQAFLEERVVVKQDIKVDLQRYLAEMRRKALAREAATLMTASRIQRSRRGILGLRFADRCVGAPRRYVNDIIAYRKGKFLAGRKCLCGGYFRPGHEESCAALEGKQTLRRKELKESLLMEKRLSKLYWTNGGDRSMRVRLGVVDYLLNKGRFDEVGVILQQVKDQVSKAYSLRCSEKKGVEEEARLRARG